MNKPLISIVIVSYNVKQLLEQCLLTLMQHSKAEQKKEIFVVDNGSSDGTVEMLEKKFSFVKLIVNEGNLGFPAANNRAFRLCSGKYIFMLNPDTEFLEDAIAVLVSQMEANGEIGIIAPRLLNTDKTIQQSVWRFPTLWSVFCELHYLHFLNGKHNYADQEKKVSFDADSVSGAAIFFRTEILSRVGYLDEEMFWIEDVEFCYRAKLKKIRCTYFPNVAIVHHVGQSAKKNYVVSISNQVFNKIKFFRKHHPGIEAVLVVWMSLVHCAWKLVLFGILSPFERKFRAKCRAYAYTFPRVFNPPKKM